MREELEKAWAVLAHEGELRWFAKRGQFDALGGVARSVDELQGRQSANDKGYNIYVQLNPAVGFRGLRTGANDVTSFRGFLLDLDPVPGAGEGICVAALRECVGVLGLGQPLLLNSGRGAQAWFMGPVVAPQEPDWRKIARRTVSRLVKGLTLLEGVKADPMVCDVSRVVRCPGFKNTKTGRLAMVLDMGRPNPRLWDALVALDPGETAAGATKLENSHDSYRQVWTEMTSTAQRFTQEGWTYPGRHTVLWHTAENLKELGLTWAATARALWLGAEASNPALSWADVEYALFRAYGGEKQVDSTRKKG